MQAGGDDSPRRHEGHEGHEGKRFGGLACRTRGRNRGASAPGARVARVGLRIGTLQGAVASGLSVERQVPIPVSYKGVELGTGVRVDLLVERLVVVEVKACERLTDIHRAQLLTYLKLTGHTVGLLINFNVELLRDGMRRVLNG